MSEDKIYRCDFCFTEQRASQDVYWASRITRVAWKVPEDGINGGQFDGDMCWQCRKKVSAAIDRVRDQIREEIKNKAKVN